MVYTRVKQAPHKLVLQYWYFYYDDLYSYDYPPDDLFWQAHEGDWEVVSVVLDRDSQRPLVVAYSQHCTGTVRRWSAVGKVGTHPVDHVAIGSHANLLDGGSQAVATSCIPAAGAADPGRPTGCRHRSTGPATARPTGRHSIGLGDADRASPDGPRADALDRLRRHLGRVRGVPRTAADRHGCTRDDLTDLAGADSALAAPADGDLGLAARVRGRTGARSDVGRAPVRGRLRALPDPPAGEVFRWRRSSWWWRFTAFALIAAGCGSPASSSNAVGRQQRRLDCTPAALQTLTPGTLTIGTDNPAYDPYFTGPAGGQWKGKYNHDPTTGQGFEDAVAYAVAQQLGYTPRARSTGRR